MAQKGTLVRHRSKPDWGAGVVVGAAGDNYVWIICEGDGSKRKFRTDKLDSWFDVGISDVPADSPLRDESRWGELEALPADHDSGSEARDARVCEHCNSLLKEARRARDERWKSCPSCSRRNGIQHVYYRSPEAFGTSPRRITPNNPDGVQSYCEACRAGDTPTSQPRLCEDVFPH